MRTELLLDEAVGEKARCAILDVAHLESGNFGALVAASGLDPARDFRHSDLREVDFTDTDLTGFDFTGADLRWACGIRVRWNDAATRLTDAQLTGSIFAHRMAVRSVLHGDETRAMASRVRGLGWANQSLWAIARLRMHNPDLERDRAIAWSIFDETRDDWLKGDIMAGLERSASPDDDATYDMIMDFMNVGSGDPALVTKIVGILSRSRNRKHPRVISAVKALMASRNDTVVACAVEFLVVGANKAEMRDLGEFALSRRARQIRSAFIAGLAERLGPAYSMLARNQLTRDFRDAHERVTAQEMELLVRNVTREVHRERSEIDLGKKVNPVFSNTFGEAIRNRAVETKITSMFEEMKELGLPYRVDL